MARTIFGGSSSGVGGSSATPAITTTVTAGEAVQQGDILVQGADGSAYWAMDPSKLSTGAALRPLSAVAAAVGMLLAPTATNALVSSQSAYVLNDAQSARLSNGNVVHTWSNSSAPYNSVFMITDPVGGVIAPPTNGPVNSSGTGVVICALTGGGFVLASVSQAAGYNTYFTVYDNNGAVTVATTRFGSGTQVGTGSYMVLALLALSNGNFAMAADMVSGATQVPHLGVFTPAGAVVRAVAQVIAPTAGAGPASSTTSLVQLTGGGFGMACSTSDGLNTTARFLTFNAAGVQQGATISGRTRVSGLGQLRAVALQNGGWMVAEVSAATFIPFVYIFNAAGVQQGATIIDLDTGGAYVVTLGNPVLLSSGNVFLTFVGGTVSHGISAFVLTPAGAKLAGTGTTGNVIMTGQSGLAPVLIPVGNDAIGMYPGNGSVLKTFKYTASAITPYLADISVACVSGNNGTRLIPTVFATAPAGAVTFMVVGVAPTTVTVESRCLYRQASTPIGVASASAASSSAVPVQITGNATLRQGFAQPVSIDATGSTIPGQRMSVVGNQAILNGIQLANTGRRQIN